MTVKSKIIFIVLLGVFACVLISVLGTVSGNLTNRSLAVREGIDRTLIDMLCTRVLEKTFLVSGDEATWSLLNQKLASAKTDLAQAEELSTQFRPRIQELAAMLKGYEEGLAEVRKVVLDLNQQTEAYARAGRDMVTFLENALIFPLKQEATQAGFSGESISAARQGVLDNAKNVLDILSRQRLNAQELIIFQNEERYRETRLEQEKEKAAFLKNLRQAITLSRDKNFKDIFVEVESKVKNLADIESRMAELFQHRLKLGAEFETTGSQLVLQGNELLEVIRQDSLATMTRLGQLGWILVGFVALALLVMGMAIGRSISIPLRRIQEYARRVAGGNLDAAPEGSFSGEMAKLRDDIGHMVGKLGEQMAESAEKRQEAANETKRAKRAMAEAQEARQMAERAKRDGEIAAANRLESIASRIHGSAQELAEFSRLTSQGAQNQRERVAESLMAMDQMNAAILEVARTAGEASQQADQARQRAQLGAEVVGRAVNAIDRVRQLSDKLTHNTNQLGEQTEAIGRIIGVINDIADQTNLLALNAAIEAARAGESGRGFAVVADEVRKLAEKTMGATRDVGAAIKSIQEGSAHSVQDMKTAYAAVVEATRLSEDSGIALHEIVGMSSSTSDQVSSIATASEEQSSTSDQINRSVLDVERISTQTVEHSDQALRLITQLTGLVVDLTSLIKDMRTG